MHNLELIRQELLGCIERWSSEISCKAARPTMACGVLQRCYSLIDEMLAICVDRAVALTGGAGQEACRACGAGKPLNRLTLGQRVQILISLDCAMARAIQCEHPTRKQRLLGKAGGHLLQAIARHRNDFAHDLASLADKEIMRTLELARKFCALDLLLFLSAVPIRESTHKQTLR